MNPQGRRKWQRWPFAVALVLGAAAMVAGTAGWGAAPAAQASSMPAVSPAGAVGATSLQGDFAAAAKEFQVPESVLLAVSYQESLWESHSGHPSVTGNYNVMGLTQLDPADAVALPAAQRRAALSQRGGQGRGAAPRPSAAALAAVNRIPAGDPALHTVNAAAALIHASPAAVRSSMRQSVRAGAALLAQDERAVSGTLPASPGLWYAAVARYSGARDAGPAMLFADRVYAVIRRGAARMTADGQQVVLRADPSVTPDRALVSKLGLAAAPAAAGATPAPECPPGLACSFVPAAYCCAAGNYGNYDVANRPADGDAIRYIVIHDTEGSYSSTISSFKNHTSYVSAHYVVQSSTGAVTQMVATKNIAWHAGNWYVNMHAVGIENEGYALKGATWYTPSEYQSSAALVKYLAARFSIPLDRQHIIGHDDVPGPIDSYAAGMHWDPGPYWDWTYFMQLAGAPAPQPAAAPPPVGSEISIDPPFTAANEPTVTGCTTSTGAITTCPKQPANFVYLRTSASATAPLLADPYLHSSGAGTTRAWDWGDKAVWGQTFTVAGEQGSWTAIWYAGRKAWFYDPSGRDTAPVTGSQQMVITPRGTSAIPVYGRAYPEKSAYPPGVTYQTISPLSKYTIAPGQEYVPETPGSPVGGDYADTGYKTPETFVTGTTGYYPIRFNHRLAYVKASDVKLVPATPPAA